MRTCNKCGFIGEDILFTKNRNTCKRCANAASKIWRENNKEKDMERKRIYRKNHPERGCIANKKWKEKNPEKAKAATALWRKNNIGRVKAQNSIRNKKWRQYNIEKEKENHRTYYIKNIEEVKEKVSEYKRTPVGKIITRKASAKRRRSLGFEPINEYFDGSEAHHLRYINIYNEKDDNIVIYIPKELHNSIYHNGNTGYGMDIINKLALEWYFSTISSEIKDIKLLKLYDYYKSLL